MTKIAAGVIPVIVLYVVQQACMPFETLQLWVATGTLPVALLFIATYVSERPWRHWFGTSLLLIAVAVMFYTLSIILFRIFGDSYPGRAEMVIASVGLTWTAMVMRTCVLVGQQWHDGNGIGHWLRRRVTGTEAPAVVERRRRRASDIP